MINERELIDKLRPFMTEDERKTFLGFLVTAAPLALSFILLFAADGFLLKGLGWIFFTLFNVRMFVLYHDYCHGAIFRKSVWIGRLMKLYGLSIIIPYSIWCESHNDHHKNNSKYNKQVGGQVIVLDLKAWKSLKLRYKILYLVFRHPLVAVTGYFTSFLIMTVAYILRRPAKHYSGLVSIAFHILLLVAIYRWSGLENFIFVFSSLVASTGIGTFLFIAQHTYPEAKYLRDKDWTLVKASLQTTSYFKMGPVMQWFTANIGFHHVHHISTRIPYYRLPEAMAAVPELQNPHIVTWRPRDVLGVMFSAFLWDEANEMMVGIHEIFRRPSSFTASPLAASVQDS